MADRVVPVDVRALIVGWPEDAPRGAVTRFCERQGVSRSRFYEIRALVAATGGRALPRGCGRHPSPSEPSPASPSRSTSRRDHRTPSL